jgi:hypothetical protein
MSTESLEELEREIRLLELISDGVLPFSALSWLFWVSGDKPGLCNVWQGFQPLW